MLPLPSTLQVVYFPELSVSQQYGAALLPHEFCWLTFVGVGFGGGGGGGGLFASAAGAAMPTAKRAVRAKILEKCMLL